MRLGRKQPGHKKYSNHNWVKTETQEQGSLFALPTPAVPVPALSSTPGKSGSLESRKPLGAAWERRGFASSQRDAGFGWKVWPGLVPAHARSLLARVFSFAAQPTCCPTYSDAVSLVCRVAPVAAHPAAPGTGTTAHLEQRAAPNPSCMGGRVGVGGLTGRLV